MILVLPDIREHNFVFGEMTEAEIEEKKKLFEEHQKNKVVTAALPRLQKKRRQISDVAKTSKTSFQTKDKTTRAATT